MLSERIPHDEGCNSIYEPWKEPNECDCYVSEVAKLERALDKRLRQEYMDEDHRLGGIGISFEQFREGALADLPEDALKKQQRGCHTVECGARILAGMDCICGFKVR